VSDAVVAVNISGSQARLEPEMGTLGAKSGGREIGAQTRGVVLAFDGYNLCATGESTKTITAGSDANHMPVVLTYDARGNGDGATVNTLAGDHANRVTDYTPLVFKIRGGVERDASGKGAGKGFLGAVDEAFTLGTSQDQYVAVRASGAANAEAMDDCIPTISVGAHAAAPGLNGQDQVAYAVALHRARMERGELGGPLPMHPRRLMPVECERLMSWPSGWTERGIDERGREYRLKDTPRYKLCGNGVASVVSAWIGHRLALAIIAGGVNA
jgi:hypothetical protein